MRLTCPGCRTPIDPENVNVSTDVAMCGACGEVYEASALVADVDLGQVLEPPAGSGIVFEADASGDGAFHIPRTGLRWGDVFPIGMATFVLAFMVFWTWGASRGSWWFAMFSIPFWIMDLLMWRGILIGVTERQTLSVDRESLTVEKRSVVSSGRIVVPIEDIRSVELDRARATNSFTMARYMRRASGLAWDRGIDLPTITHGTSKTRFAEHVSEAEMEWLVTVVRAIVHRLSGTRA
jgi:hypothetical protein